MVSGLTSAFDALMGLQHALDGARDFDYFGHGTPMRGGYPTVNFFRKGEELVLTAELPGLNKDDVNIEVKGDLLRISGERKPDFSKPEVSIHRIERDFSRFDRTVKLPFIVDSTRVNAKYENGILLVNLQQAEEDKPRKITVG